ncbi:MAG: DUF6545 domain-containing protein [Candidatus Dormibacteraceae bacterium]
MVGATLPSWGPKGGFDLLARRLAEWWALQRLFALWQLLRKAKPEVTLAPEPSRLYEALQVGETGWHLRRLVIEAQGRAAAPAL